MSISDPGPPRSAPARRPRAAAWRDPRLLLGVVLVAGSVAVGAAVVGSPDEGVPVWVAAHDLGPGTLVTAEDLEARRVRFPDEETASAYVSAGAMPDPETRVVVAVAAGDLVPASALRLGGPGLVELPVPVEPGEVPATVRTGSVVDVWVVPEQSVTPAGDGPLDEGTATKVVDDAVVLSVPTAGGLAEGSTRGLVVGLPDSASTPLSRIIAGLDTGHVVVTRQG